MGIRHKPVTLRRLLLLTFCLSAAGHQIRQALVDDLGFEGVADPFSQQQWADVPSPLEELNAPQRTSVVTLPSPSYASSSGDIAGGSFMDTLSVGEEGSVQKVVQSTGDTDCPCTGRPNCDCRNSGSGTMATPTMQVNDGLTVQSSGDAGCPCTGRPYCDCRNRGSGTMANPTMQVTPAAAIGSSSCTPQCMWKCESQKCDEVCKPKCKAPRCETRCPSRPDLSTCSFQCDEPTCAVVCPERKCPKQGCPFCETHCSTPQCKLACTGNQTCTTACEQPECDWECKAPEACPRPKCEMVCEQPPACMHNMRTHHTLPALKPGELSIKAFTADATNLKPDIGASPTLLQVEAFHQEKEGGAPTSQVLELPIKLPAVSP